LLTKGQQLLEVPDAHEGFVRSVAIHPTDLLMVSGSDDLTCKLWDISTACTLLRTFDVHTGLVMDVKWNPRDPTTFASCSLDGTSVFWELSSEQPRFTQKMGTKCLNSIGFLPKGDRSLLAAASDDQTAQIWDLQSRSNLATLTGHEHNVTRAEFHPTRPIIITTSEDCCTHIWSTITFKRETTINAGFDRGWALAISSATPVFAVGYDKGLIVAKFVHDGIPISLDASGKVAIAHGTELSVATIRQVGEIVDGAELSLAWKEALASEVPPIELLYSPNGRFIVTLSDGDWNIYTALGLRSRAYGQGLRFAWASNSENFAVIDLGYTIPFYSRFERVETVETYARRLWGGELLSALVDGGVEFYDWADQRLIRRMEAKACEVKWCRDLVAIRTKDSIFVLEFNRECQADWTKDSGFSDAFNVLHDIDVKSGSIHWHHGVLFFSEGVKINRFVGGVVQVTTTLKGPTEILGYLPREDLLVLADQRRQILGVTFPAALLQFESEVASGEEPNPQSVPEQYQSRCAKFLKQIGRLEIALEMSKDPAMKLDLAIELNRLDVAEEVACDPSMWKRVARAALLKGEVDLAVKALGNSGDFASLLVLLKAKNRAEDMKHLIDQADAAGQLNVAFSAALLIGQKEQCVHLLLKSGKIAEAALVTRSNVPEMVSQCVKEWKEKLPNRKISEALADPEEYPGLFDELLHT
jgi:coatomer subunit beta'